MRFGFATYEDLPKPPNLRPLTPWGYRTKVDLRNAARQEAAEQELSRLESLPDSDVQWFALNGYDVKARIDQIYGALEWELHTTYR